MLETPRLRLREVEQRDAALLIALRTDPDVRRYLGGPMTLDAAMTMADLNISHSYWLFVAERRDTDESIGLVLLHPGHGGTEISYQFLPSSWSQGFAAEAVRRVMDYAFDSEGIDELLAITQTANERSRGLLERVGMTASEEFEEFGEPQMLYRAQRSISKRPTTLAWGAS
jgi:[ribosomal protein S5]-alanine N-acetyltransferase